MIRRMEEADLPQVAENEALCFSAPWSERALRDTLARQDAIYFVAEEEGRIVGHCGVTNILGEGDVTNVAVRPDWQGRKIGQALLNTLLAEGTKAGIIAFTLEVRAGNATAIHLYEKAGFITEGVRRGFYDNPKEDALIMWKR